MLILCINSLYIVLVEQQRLDARHTTLRCTFEGLILKCKYNQLLGQLHGWMALRIDLV